MSGDLRWIAANGIQSERVVDREDAGVRARMFSVEMEEIRGVQKAAHLSLVKEK